MSFILFDNEQLSFYRGIGKIEHSTEHHLYTIVRLPECAKHLANSFTIHITPMMNFNVNFVIDYPQLCVSNIDTAENNARFKVLADMPCMFSWMVIGRKIEQEKKNKKSNNK